MRSSWKVVLALVLPAGVLPAVPASAGPAPAQTIEGTIRAPLRFPLDATYASWPGGQRQAYTVAGSNGDVGYTFGLKKGLDGGRFVLEPTGGATGEEDLDITFYASFSPVVSTGQFQDRRPGGESYTIPGGSRFGVVTMFDGANAELRFRAFAPGPEAKALGGIAPPPLPAKPGILADFGKGDTEHALRLRSRSHVVIAVVDTGINPYHVAYRRPEYAVHPSEFIEGFPKSAPALGLSFGVKDYLKARAKDDGPVWSKVEEHRLYWIPGTNIVGAYSDYDAFDDTPLIGETLPEGVEHSRPILDDNGHGTGTTSVAAGGAVSAQTRAPFGSNPDALIVIVEGLGDKAVKWASEQPWIDFISGSYGDPTATPYNDTVPDLPELPQPAGRLDSREYRYTDPFVLRDGRTACFSAGNGLTRTGVATDRYSSLRPTSGPSWVVTVGAASPRNDQDYGWHSVPVDLSSYGNHWPAAAPFSTDGEQGFGGTSNAAPLTCGVFSKALLEARRSLGDAVEGIHVASDGTRVPSLGPSGLAKGLLADGVLTREEFRDAVFKTALPAALDAVRFTYDPVVIPDSPVYYTQEGYGIANVASAKRAVEVILGRAPMPDRAEVDAWIATIDAVRNAVYPPHTYEKRAPKPAPKPKPKARVLGKKMLPETGVGTRVLAGLVLLAAAGLLRRRLALAR